MFVKCLFILLVCYNHKIVVDDYKIPPVEDYETCRGITEKLYSISFVWGFYEI